jgi:hypothetical protein
MTLLRLRLRRWFLGWGYHPDELRFLSLYLQRDARLCVLYAIFLPAILVVIQTINRRPVTLDFIVHVTLVLLILFLAIALLLLAVAFVYRRRARAATLNPEHLMGYRYGIAFDPPSPCYVRFGLTADIAKWYLVPLEWEEIISTALPDTPFELWVLPVTGWVERLRRGGAEPLEVSQPVPEPLPAGDAVPDEHTREEAAADQPEDEGATREEARAMKRFARRAGLTWLATPRHLFWSWVSSLTIGALICVGGLVFMAWLIATYPLAFRSEEGRVAFAVVLAFFEICGLAVCVMGLWPLAAWRRVRRLDATPTEAMGEVVAWMRYRNWYGPFSIRNDQRREKLIQLRAANGTEQILRLPPKLAHRVQRRGEHVRITYRVGSGHVLDVRHVEAPVQAAVTDGIV